jgi:signal transduction histidine kinase
MQSFKNLRIVTKFIVWFLIISLTPLAIATYLSYTSSRKALKDEATSRLTAIADSKASQIEGYLRKAKKDAATVAYVPEVVEALGRLADVYRSLGPDAPEYGSLEQEFRPIAAYYQQSFGYDDIFMFNSDGSALFAIKEKKYSKSLYEIALERGSELTNIFIKAKASQETELSNFEYDHAAKKVVFFIATPVFQATGLLGVVVIRVNSQGIDEFVQDYTGLGKTGETIIAAKRQEGAVFITPCRSDPQAAFKRTVPSGSPAGLDIQRAIGGENGSGLTLDYQKRRVLAAWRHLPSIDLGMVVKMDEREVSASANRLRTTLAWVSLVLLGAVVLAAVLIAYSISTPVKELTMISGVIAQGDLSARAPVHAGDEIGRLAQSFNQMTDSLVEAKDHVEQKKAEVEEQKRLLEEANKELDSFVYTVSHDLRAPLRGIDGFANFLQQDYAEKLDSQAKDYLNRIRSGANRMKDLIDDLLTLSRISRIKNPYEDVDINELVRSVIARIEFDITTYSVEMVIAENLPVMRCDKIKMAEVFLNLINNAIKFSSKNKDTKPHVQVGYADKAGAHEFFVKDNGIGIDKKYHQEVFGIFKRLHKQDEYEGTGAGLSIVKRIIDDHHGSIWIESEPGKGAAFFFSLPKVAQEEKMPGIEDV